MLSALRYTAIRRITLWIAATASSVTFYSCSYPPCEIYERKVTVEQLHAAIAALPDKQAKRIYAYYFLGRSIRLWNRKNCSLFIR